MGQTVLDGLRKRSTSTFAVAISAHRLGKNPVPQTPEKRREARKGRYAALPRMPTQHPVQGGLSCNGKSKKRTRGTVALDQEGGKYITSDA